MGADGRILWEVDGLFGLITLFLWFNRSLSERIDFFLFLLELLLLHLRLEFVDLLAKLAYLLQLRFTTPQQNCGDYVQRRLELSDLFVP